jgi:hypothetical protein
MHPLPRVPAGLRRDLRDRRCRRCTWPVSPMPRRPPRRAKMNRRTRGYVRI